MIKPLTHIYEMNSAIVVEFLEAQLVDQIEILQISEEIRRETDKRQSPKVVICFSKVQHCSSSLLSILIELRAHLMAKEGQLCLSGVSNELQNLLRTVQLDRILEMYETTREAVSSID